MPCGAALGTFERDGRRSVPSDERGTFGEHLALGIVNDHAGQLFPIAKALDDMPELLVRASFQSWLHDFLKTLGENFGAPLEVGAQPAFFRAHLVSGKEECNQSNPHNQEED